MKRTNLTTIAALPLVLALGGCMNSHSEAMLLNDGPAYSGTERHPIHASHNGKSAHVHNCGDWSHDVTDNSANRLTDNHGCAMQTNIAAMVANPRDFQRVVPPSPPRDSAADVTAARKAGSSGTSGSNNLFGRIFGF